MASTDTLLPLGEVTGRLRILGQSYAGMQTIPIDHIVGSVDRAVDFDRFFKPRKRGDLNQRMKSLRKAFADRPMPPISVYEASGLYFVSDGHHRVAVARQDGGEFIDADVTALKLSHAITPDVDLWQLIHTEQNRQFMERSGLADSHPELTIEFSRPIGYWELTDLLEAYAYEEGAKTGRFVSMPEATAMWFNTCWTPAQKAIANTALPKLYSFKTDADRYLWVHQKLRELRTIDRSATWQDAANARAAEPVQKSHVETARREQRKLLPKAERAAKS